MKRTSILLLILLACCWNACEKTDIAEGAIDRKVVNANVASQSIDQEKLLALINQLRATGSVCGGNALPSVPPLSWSNQLQNAAVLHAIDMHKYNRLSHEGSNGSSMGQRATAAGYKWATIGENVALGSTTEEQVIEQWKNSGGHCANMMSERYTQIGIGRSGKYWTLLLARPQ